MLRIFTHRETKTKASGAFTVDWSFSAYNMMCTVTQGVRQTIYTILGLQHGSHCNSSWSNESDIVLADHWGQFVEPVISSNLSTLVTSKCIRNVTFSGICIHEGTAQDYTASCIASCAREPLIVDEGNSWIVGVVIVLLLLLLLGLLGFLCCKYETWRKCSCRQTGGFYNAVKFQTSQQAADVESGKAAVQEASTKL